MQIEYAAAVERLKEAKAAVSIQRYVSDKKKNVLSDVLFRVKLQGYINNSTTVVLSVTAYYYFIRELPFYLLTCGGGGRISLREVDSPLHFLNLYPNDLFLFTQTNLVWVNFLYFEDIFFTSEKS